MYVSISRIRNKIARITERTTSDDDIREYIRIADAEIDGALCELYQTPFIVDRAIIVVTDYTAAAGRSVQLETSGLIAYKTTIQTVQGAISNNDLASLLAQALNNLSGLSAVASDNRVTIVPNVRGVFIDMLTTNAKTGLSLRLHAVEYLIQVTSEELTVANLLSDRYGESTPNASDYATALFERAQERLGRLQNGDLKLSTLNPKKPIGEAGDVFVCSNTYDPVTNTETALRFPLEGNNQAGHPYFL